MVSCPDQHPFFGSDVSFIMPYPMSGKTVICVVGAAPRGRPNPGKEYLTFLGSHVKYIDQSESSQSWQIGWKELASDE